MQAARKVDIAYAGGVVEGEAAGHDADDGVWGVVEFQRSADDVRIAAEVALPEAVVQNDDGAGRRSDRRMARCCVRAKRAHTKECPGILGEVGADESSGSRAAGDLHIRAAEAKQLDRPARPGDYQTVVSSCEPARARPDAVRR